MVTCVGMSPSRLPNDAVCIIYILWLGTTYTLTSTDNPISHRYIQKVAFRILNSEHALHKHAVPTQYRTRIASSWPRRGTGGGGGMIPLPRTVLAVSVRLAVLGDDSSITNVQREYENRKGKI